MTSNIGSGILLESPDAEDNREKIMELVKAHFRPEFINRVDDIIFFHSLNKDHLKQIVRIQLANFRERLTELGIDLTIDDKAAEYLAEAGFDPVYGARPLKRIIVKEIETPVSRMLVADQLSHGDKLHVTMEGGSLKFRNS